MDLERQNTEDALIDKMKSFLFEIGISVEERSLSPDTFLPGLSIDKGVLLIDRAQLLYPGDILHEAGHIATTPLEHRPEMGGNMDTSMGDDIAAILWSYAALRFLDIAPEILFHTAGYKGSSAWYIENFSAKNYIGLPLLEWMGMAYTKERALEKNVKPYPEMLRWLR